MLKEIMKEKNEVKAMYKRAPLRRKLAAQGIAFTIAVPAAVLSMTLQKKLTEKMEDSIIGGREKDMKKKIAVYYAAAFTIGFIVSATAAVISNKAIKEYLK